MNGPARKQTNLNSRVIRGNKSASFFPPKFTIFREKKTWLGTKIYCNKCDNRLPKKFDFKIKGLFL